MGEREREKKRRRRVHTPMAGGAIDKFVHDLHMP
jgi:hypothetical protein